jgi:hypothetical protein
LIKEQVSSQRQSQRQAPQKECATHFAVPARIDELKSAREYIGIDKIDGPLLFIKKTLMSISRAGGMR